MPCSYASHKHVHTGVRPSVVVDHKDSRLRRIVDHRVEVLALCPIRIQRGDVHARHPDCKRAQAIKPSTLAVVWLAREPPLALCICVCTPGRTGVDAGDDPAEKHAQGLFLLAFALLLPGSACARRPTLFVQALAVHRVLVRQCRVLGKVNTRAVHLAVASAC